MNATATLATLTTDEERLLAIFKALSNPVRFRMVRYMVEHPHCITGDLVEFADLAQSTVSQHLKVLRESGLVCGEVEGPARACGANEMNDIITKPDIKDKIKVELPRLHKVILVNDQARDDPV